MLFDTFVIGKTIHISPPKRVSGELAELLDSDHEQTSCHVEVVLGDKNISVAGIGASAPESLQAAMNGVLKKMRSREKTMLLPPWMKRLYTSKFMSLRFIHEGSDSASPLRMEIWSTVEETYANGADVGASGKNSEDCFRKIQRLVLNDRVHASKMTRLAEEMATMIRQQKLTQINMTAVSWLWFAMDDLRREIPPKVRTTEKVLPPRRKSLGET